MFGTNNTKLKKSILKEIYVDNLRVAGKPIETDPLPKSVLLKKSLQMLLVFLTVTLAFFSELAPSLSVNEPVIQTSLPAAPDEINEPSHFLIFDEANPFESHTSTPVQLSFQMPTWSFSGAESQNFKAYSLLLFQNDYTRLSSLFGLGIKTIVIDPGHGGKDPGAIGAKGTKEKEVTLDVAVRLKKRLESLDQFNILMTRKTDEFLTLAERVDFAKKNRADLFISIHVNSLPNENVNLIETYYFGPPLNSETFRLAEKENQESHFSVSELEGIIQDIGNTVKRQESEMLAAAIQSSLYSHLSHQDPEVINSGVKMAPFVVLSQIEVPSVLVEISCLTNEDEEAKLKTSKYREKIASYIDEGIVAYLDLKYFKTINGEN